MRTKLLMLLMTLLFVTSCASSQRASYTHHFGRYDASIVSCGAVNLDGELALYVDLAGLSFAADPKIRFVSRTGEELVLNGIVVDTYDEKKSGDSFSVHHSLAQFPLRPEDVAFFDSGIKELWIGSLPYVHDHIFSSRKFGKKLNRLVVRAAE